MQGQTRIKSSQAVFKSWTIRGSSMSLQVSKHAFSEALMELGHDPNQYDGKRLSLAGMIDLYGVEEDLVISAIRNKVIAAHYDYQNDTIWIDALDAAHFYYCLSSARALLAG